MNALYLGQESELFRETTSAWIEQAQEEHRNAGIWRAVAVFWFLAFTCLGVALIFIEVSK